MSLPEDKVGVEGAKVTDQVEEPVPASGSAVSEVAMDTKKALVLEGISALLEREPVDPTDRGLILSAVAFVEKPSDTLVDIQRHTTRIGQVSAGYMMNGEDTPMEIDALEAYLFALQCMNRMDFVRGEMSRGVYYSAEIAQAMVLALDWATTLARGYKDNSQLEAVTELLGRLEQLRGE